MAKEKQKRIRLAADTRHDQLVDLGVALLGEYSLDEITVELLAEKSKISRGLVYHYFGTKQGFHKEVIAKASTAIFEYLQPTFDAGVQTELEKGLDRFLDVIQNNFAGYLTLIRTPGTGSRAESPAIYDLIRDQFAELLVTNRIQIKLGSAEISDQTAHNLIRGWFAFVEELSIAWTRNPGDLSREQLVAKLAASLPLMLKL